MEGGTRHLLAGGGGGGEAGFLTLLNEMPHHQDVATVWIIVGLLILINFLWELFTDGLEHIFWNKNRHIIVMMEKLYKELTIVGLWSVFLFVLTSTFGVKNETLKHVFELIHISLFGLVLIYIGVMIFMAFLSLVMFRRFHMLEELDEATVNRNYEADRQWRREHLFLYLINPISLFRSYVRKSQHNYYTIRAFFIKQIRLEDTFHFDAYLKRAMKGTFTEWAQIHWSVLAIVLLFQLAIWMAFITVLPYHKGIPYTVLAVLCFMSFFTLWMKIDMVYMTLKEKPEIWDLPRSRYADTDDEGALPHEGAQPSVPENGSYEIEMDETPSHKSDFHLRVHESSSEDDTDSAKHRNHRSKVTHTRRAHKPAFAHYSSSSDSSVISEASWVSTWESSETWESVEEIGDEREDGVRRQRHHRHHHQHHHHHHAHHTKHHHQSDLQWISGCLIPFITCRLSPRDVRRYITPTPHQSLFWFGSPGFFLYMCHVTTFWQAIVLAMVIGSFCGFLEIHWGYWIAPSVLSLINLLFFVPLIVYHYSFCMNVGEFTKFEFIKQVNSKARHERATKKKDNQSDDESDLSDLSLNGSTSPSPRSIHELWAEEDEKMGRSLPPHPRHSLLTRHQRPLAEESLTNLVMNTPVISSSSSSESD